MNNFTFYMYIVYIYFVDEMLYYSVVLDSQCSDGAEIMVII